MYPIAKFYFFYSSVFQILLIVIFLPALFPLVCKFSSVNVFRHLYVNVCNLFISYWGLILVSYHVHTPFHMAQHKPYPIDYKSS